MSDARLTPIKHIRTKVLDITQAELAAGAGVTQATVSRWESGELSPSMEELARIRAMALKGGKSKGGKSWNDKWFFEVPPVNSKAGQAA